MKKNEDEFEKWIPFNNIPTTIYVEGIYDDYEGFRILIRGSEITSPMIRIKFENYLGYQNIDESNRYTFLNNFPSNSREWCLFKSYNSSYINWIIKEGGGKYKIGEIIHFAIVTGNDVVDVLALEEPIVEDL